MFRLLFDASAPRIFFNNSHIPYCRIRASKMATSTPKIIPKVVPKAVSPVEPEAEAPVVKKSRKKLFVILAILILLSGGGAGAWYFLDQGADTNAVADKAKPEPASTPVFVVLDPFTVNLQSEGGDQFLQVAFTLQVADQAEVDLIKLYMPQVRSRVLLMLSSKRASEISTLDGKKKLADEIIAQVKQPFNPKGASLGISNVFFTSFVIQ